VPTSQDPVVGFRKKWEGMKRGKDSRRSEAKQEDGKESSRKAAQEQSVMKSPNIFIRSLPVNTEKT